MFSCGWHFWADFGQVKGERLNDIALLKSLAIWDHTVLPATQHKWTEPNVTPARQPGTRFTYPRRIGHWVDLNDLLHTEMVYLLTGGHPFKYWPCSALVIKSHCSLIFTVENRQRLLRWITPITRNCSLVCLEILCPLLLPATFMSYQRCVRWLVVAVHRRPSSKLGSVFSSFY